MPRKSLLPRNSKVENKAILDAHRAATDAEPLTEDDVQLWMNSLSRLDDAIGKEEQLRVCRDLMRHAPDDDMLGSDRTIVKHAIEQLEEELAREPRTSARHTRRDGGTIPIDVCAEDDDSADDPEGYPVAIHDFD